MSFSIRLKYVLKKKTEGFRQSKIIFPKYLIFQYSILFLLLL